MVIKPKQTIQKKSKRWTKKPPTKNHAEKKQGWLAGAMKWLSTLAVWTVIVVGGLMVWYGSDLPDVDKIVNSTRQPSVTILAGDDTVLLKSGDLYGLPVTLDDIPPALVQAVIATEDRRFYDHFGLDLMGLVRATVANIMAGRIVQGGSTLTQQVAKNIFLSPERTLKRKIQELLLALWLENKFTKDQILTLYLNRVYLGSGTYGVTAAAKKYFGKSVQALNIYQSALIAGLLKAPSRYNPISSKKRSRERTLQVIKNMVAAGYLNETGAAIASKGGGDIVQFKKRNSMGRYYADWVQERLKSYVSPGGRDLVVKTTLNKKLQLVAEKKLNDLITKIGKKSNVGQGSVVVMAFDGAVLTMVGGRNYTKSQYNRAVSSKRQPGSAFKPVVYLAAIEAGMKPSDIINDEPITINGWKPKNFNRRFQGKMTMENALAKSVNTVAVQLSEKVGRDNVVELAGRLGVTSNIKPHPSLALGVNEVSLLELTSVYGVFANGGYGVWPYAIRSIEDSQGVVLYERSGSGPGRVADVNDIKKLDSMLAEVVLNGTGKAAKIDARSKGKTGTSQKFRDAWFVGYNDTVVAGVWLGNDNGKPMKRVGGGGYPAKLWRDVVKSSQAYEIKTINRRQMNESQALPEPKNFWGQVKDIFEGSDR